MLVLRVSDRTGGALRRVSRDLGGMQTRRDLSAQMQQARNIERLTGLRAREMRQKSQDATMTLRNMRLQRDAAAQAITALKQQSLQNATTMNEIRAQTTAYNQLTAAIARQSDVAKGLRTTRLSTAFADAKATANVNNLNKAQAALRWQGLERGIHLAQHLGRALAIGGTIGVLALGSTAKQAATAQTEVALAATQARTPGAGAGQTLQIQRGLMKVVLDQMKQFPAASADMANSLYEIFSGTNIQKIPQAAEMLRTFNKMAVAGGTDLKTMTDAGLTLYNNFMQGATPEFRSMAGAADEFFKIVRYGRMSASQFAGSLSQIIPIAQRAGLSFHDIGAAMAFVTRQTGGTRARYDATGLARLIEAFNNPNVQKGLKTYGVNVLDPTTKKMHSLFDIMTAIAKRVPNLQGAESLNFFKQIGALGSGGKSQGTTGFINARRLFSYLYEGIKTGQYAKVLQDISRDQNEFNKSYAAMAQQPGVKWQVFTNQLKALAIVVGSAVIPVFGQLGDYIQAAVNWFQRLSPHTQRLIAQMALFASVGALVGGVLLAVIGGFGAFFLTIRGGLKSFGLLGAETGSVRLAMLGMIPAVIGVLILLQQYPGILHTVVDYLGGTKNAIILLGIAIAALKFAPLIGGLGMVTGEATAATIAVSRLRIALLGIARMSGIAVTIDVIEHIIKNDTSTKNSNIHGKGPLAWLARNIRGAEGHIPVLNALMTAAEQLGNKIVPPKGPPRATWEGVQGPFQGTAAETDPTGRNVAGRTRAYLRSVQAHKRALDLQSSALAASTGLPTANIAHLERNVLVAQEALRNIDPVKNFKRYMAAEERLQNAKSALQAAATTEQSRAYMKSVNARLAAETRAQKKALSEQTKAATRAAKQQNTTYADAFANLQNMYQQFYQQQQGNLGNLFQGPVLTGQKMQTLMQWGQHAGPADILRDKLAQNFQFNRFNRLIGSLGRRGAPAELTNQLRAAGPGAIQDVYALTQMTPAQWKRYVSAFKSGQQAVKQATMAQLHSQIGLYREHGKKVAQAIVAGITSQDQKVSHAIDNMLRKAIGLKPTADYKPGPHRGSITNHYHIGHTGDYHKTRATIRHSLFRTRVHTSGGF